MDVSIPKNPVAHSVQEVKRDVMDDAAPEVSNAKESSSAVADQAIPSGCLYHFLSLEPHEQNVQTVAMPPSLTYPRLNGYIK